MEGSSVMLGGGSAADQHQVDIPSSGRSGSRWAGVGERIWLTAIRRLFLTYALRPVARQETAISRAPRRLVHVGDDEIGERIFGHLRQAVRASGIICIESSPDRTSIGLDGDPLGTRLRVILLYMPASGEGHPSLQEAVVACGVIAGRDQSRVLDALIVFL